MWPYICNYLGCTPRSKIAMFDCLNNYQTVFQSGCTILTFQPAMDGDSNPSICLTTLTIFFFIITILVDLKWYLIILLICMFLMTNDFEHFFCAFISLIWRRIYLILCPFSSWVVFFIIELYPSYIPDMNIWYIPFPIYDLQYFLPFCSCLFTFFFFFNFIYLFIYGCVGSSFLCEGFL